MIDLISQGSIFCTRMMCRLHLIKKLKCIPLLFFSCMDTMYMVDKISSHPKKNILYHSDHCSYDIDKLLMLQQLFMLQNN